MFQSTIFYSNNVASECSLDKQSSALSLSDVFQYIPELFLLYHLVMI